MEHRFPCYTRSILFEKRIRSMFPRRKRRVTFQTLSREWLELRQNQVKPATLANYRTLIKVHLLPEFGPLPVCKITEARVRVYLARLAESGLSASTRRSVQLLLHMLLRYAAEQGLAKPVLFPSLPPMPHSAAGTLSDAEFLQLKDNLLRRLDDTALGILLCMHIGLRIGEICALRWGDIDLSAGTVTVSRTLQRVAAPTGTQILIHSPKSAHSVRTIPLPRQLVTLMCPFAGEPGAYVLTGGPGFMEPRRLQRNFKCILAQSGLRPANFHTLRHTFATRCAAVTDPKTLSCLLGHSSVSTTMEHYVHPRPEQMRRCLEQLSA